MKSLSSLIPYISKYKFRFFLGIIFIIAQNYFAIYPAIIIKEVFDFAEYKIGTRPDYSSSYFFADWVRNKSTVTALIIFSSLILILAIIKGLFTYLMRKTIIVNSRLIEYDLKNVMYNKFQALDISFYKKNSTGDIMNRISDDVTKVRMFLGPGLMYGINVFFLFLMIVPVMFSINIKLSLFTLMPLPIIAILVFLVSKRMYVQSDKVQMILSDITSMVQETYSGIRAVKSYMKEKLINQRMEKLSERYKKESVRRVQIDAFLIPLVMLLIGLSTIFTVYIGGIETIRGHISLGSIAQFIYYISMLTWPVMAVGWISSLTQRAAASQDRINHFLESEPNVKNIKHPIIPEIKNIVFDQVFFSYSDSGIQALKHISFELKKGQILGVTGRTGSGKSTVLNLILRNYDVDSGNIKMSGHPIQNIELEYLRKQIAYVPQEIFLFSETVRNNIAMGRDAEVSLEEVKEYSKRASVYDDIMGFNGKFDALVGERGVSLSGGQKQRISIARALIKEAPIVLLDDCLSAVDTKTEKNILDHLSKLGEGKMVIIVSHRISAVQNADKIIVLSDGELQESGTHKELMSEKSFYFDMFNQQALKTN